MVRTTNGAYGKNNSAVLWQPVLHIVVGIIGFGLHGLLVNKMKDINLNVDVLNVSPSDFAVKVNHLPNNYDKHELKQYFEQMSDSLRQPIDVLEVVSAYDIKYLLQTNEELNDLREKRAYITTRIDSGMSENDARKYKFFLCVQSKELYRKTPRDK